MSDFDWIYIRQCFENGEPANAIAKRMGRPTKQAILQRAKREGWVAEALPSSAQNGLPRLPAVAAALSISSNKLTDELLQTVLGLIAIGSTEEIAAQAAGISARTWQGWKAQEPKLKDLVRRARAGKLSEWIGRIDRASDKDWKAAKALLEAQPETRDYFSSGGGGGRVEVVININREGEGVTVESSAVDVEND